MASADPEASGRRGRAARPKGPLEQDGWRAPGLEAVIAVRRVPALGTVDADPEVLFLGRRREPALVAEAVFAHQLDVGAVRPDSGSPD